MRNAVSAIFDTVIFVRSLMNPSGRWGRLIFDRRRDYRLVVSAPVVAEVLEVIQRPELVRKYRSIGTRDPAAVRTMLASADVVEIATIPAVGRDPNDAVFLATAEAGRVAYLVTEDQDLLVLREYEGTRIVDAVAFLAILDGRGDPDAEP
ncbi:MAG: hypothetical protein AVDCRST_MAG73-2794 [uncultured Thermomicrobiales bacterium]|uniref:PIN domain-containing protein n=1 Tax=uncultured Thermomicrobiales bacterium TaxID=1645740 RepID=A0A6J4UIA2_9BACT|nr:MAG: hypothetical protein AVDCRST_MAG73-2794 [uncultured Thermomicrobiales bacterium]